MAPKKITPLATTLSKARGVNVPLGEFELIESYFRRGFPASAAVSVANGDDCAGLMLPPGEQVLTSVDTLVESVHFPVDAPAEALGYRSLMVAASDLAACGATPHAFTLCLTAPELEESWLAAFSAGLARAAADCGMALIGGDTTRGPLALSVQVLGSAPVGSALLRGGAAAGDDIYVSGSLGDARAALAYLHCESPADSQRELLQRYWYPRARLVLGQALRDIASAAIDLSDGLAADLTHILQASEVGADIELQRLPLSSALLAADEAAHNTALAGGDDYELCFTAAPSQREAIAGLAHRLALPLTRIGQTRAAAGLRCVDGQGKDHPLPSGYRHF